ncbi:MAG: SAM-dependent DNA methyltransferase [Alphaproteobacteria bacterium]|nr:SAM-dependent DNA methyltransferase [Alphaproteobacteria bacterium]
MSEQKERQTISKYRVCNYGEVMTARREVEAMLDLVKDEASCVSSRFLEPSCGNGNFLVAILERKLKTVIDNYKKKDVDLAYFEAQLLLALSSIYGIDILQDNIDVSRNRMLDIAIEAYLKALNQIPKLWFQDTMRLILCKNIIHGDSLNGTNDIIFTQWTLENEDYFELEEYAFDSLTDPQNVPLLSYPPTHYTRLLEMEWL